MQNQPRTEFAQALKAIANERKLDVAVILDSIKEAIVAAFKRDAKERGEEVEEFEYEVEMDANTGGARIFSWPLEEPDKKKDVTPPGFGRIAAQTAKQVIHQKIREAEKGAIMDEYSGRIGSLISGMILRFDGPDVRVDLGRTEGLMPASERTPSERLAPNQRLTFLLKEITETPRGKVILLSRSTPEFVEKLFAREVPEIGSGSVEIRAVVREAGLRTKLAVSSNQPGVDPVGSCVGQKGVRVQAVTNELGGERVDIIPWTDDPKEYLKAALSPAEGLTIKLSKKTLIATVIAPEDQLSIAIGKEGQNVRLASKLTGWKIEIEGDGKGVKPAEDTETKVEDSSEVRDAKPEEESAPAPVTVEKKEVPADSPADDSTQTASDDAGKTSAADSSQQPADDKGEEKTEKAESSEQVDEAK